MLEVSSVVETIKKIRNFTKQLKEVLIVFCTNQSTIVLISK